jgi:pullulanase/glycogen debranching enzyme
MGIATRPGKSYPLGAKVNTDGANFAIYSKNATAMDLLLFDGADDPAPTHVIPLDPKRNRTFHYWHVFVEGLRQGQSYGFRAYGPFEPQYGLRFDSSKVLLDPYGLAVAIPDGYDQLGTFVGDRWKEWNGPFRDDVRRFVKADPGTVSKLASRFLASPNLYGHEEREPEQSINFVTCHDGFTPKDLVSYNRKHNWANGEGNRDGQTDNLSWNCGLEGPTEEPGIERLRNRQVKNLLTINLLALGVTMLLMGDEVRCTQQGNNNAYSQDHERSWLDWTLLDTHTSTALSRSSFASAWASVCTKRIGD